jgi:glycosyltransferase involved in cell wall biosynthesis/predicted O-methyltransferase YrrM
MNDIGLHGMNPVQLGPSTILDLARQSDTLKLVQKILMQLEPDQFIKDTLDYYALGQEKYGDHWLYADQLTILYAAAQLVEIKNYLEIGVFRGRSISVVASVANTANIFGFDLWVDQYAGLSNPGPDYVINQLSRVGFKGQTTFLSGDSRITIPQFFNKNPDLMFDLVTVDGDHSIEGARFDLENVLPRVRVGGVIVFDDICHPMHLRLKEVWKEIVGANPDFATAIYTEVGHGVAVAVRKDQDEDLDGLRGSEVERLEILARSFKAAKFDLKTLETNIQILKQKLQESQNDRNNQSEVIQDLEKRLADIDSDRTSRLDVINKLDRQLEEAEKDRSVRLDVINKLNRQLEEAEKDRSARLEMIHRLEKQLKEADEDRSARLVIIHRQEQEYESDRQANLVTISQLEQKLQESEANRNASKEIITNLELRLKEAEAEQKEQGDVILSMEQSLQQVQEDLLEKRDHLKILEGLNADLRREKEISQEIRQQLNKNIHRQAYYLALYEERLSRFPVNLMSRIQNKLVWGLERSQHQLRSKIKKRSLKKIRRILIDLTPILPGGVNGGAKPMTTALIWYFSRVVEPECEYILLTSDDAHEELSWLDSTNVKRLCVNHRPSPTSATTEKPGIDEFSISESDNSSQIKKDNSDQGKQNSHTEGEKTNRKDIGLKRTDIIHSTGVILERILSPSVYSRIYLFYKRELQSPGTKKNIVDLKTDLLFCPFTAPLYHDGKTPAVIVVYDLQFKTYPQFFSDELLFQTDQNFRNSCKVASRLICISDHTKKMLIDEYGIPPGKVVTIPISLCNPVEVVPLIVAEKMLVKHDLIKGQYLLYPANFWPHKNHEMLITAFAMYKERNPGSALKLVFTGAPGSRMSYLTDIVDRIGLTACVRFVGFLDVEAFSGLLQSCLALIFPSLFEGFGIPVLEAMSLGVPVLCSNLTSLPEVGLDAVHYFDPRKPFEILAAIEKIEKFDSYRNALIEKGIERSRSFLKPENWAGEYFKVFRDVVGEGNHYHSDIFGIYPDHWMGDSLEVTIPVGGDQRFLELCLMLPEWFPQGNNSGRMTLNGKKTKKFRLDRGQRKIIRQSLTGSGLDVHVSLEETVRPIDVGIGDDIRSLGSQVLWCRLITSEGILSIHEAGIE